MNSPPFPPPAALFDLQVHGFAGVDFQQDDLDTASLELAAEALQRSHCRRFLLTLVTAPWPLLTARLRRARALRQASERLQSAIAGWHIEGPFLSPEPGYRGAHDPALMLDPTEGHIRELRALAGDDPLLLTLAPERAGALESIALAQSLGIVVSLGHTNATAEILRDAVQAGATGFTHLGNGCPQLLDRHDNILWRVVDTPGLAVSLIPDGIHVSPPLFRLLHKTLPQDRIFYVTDAMAAAGAPPGRYRLGRLELEVGSDEIVRFPGGTNFAGSALRPDAGLRRAAQMLGTSIEAVLPSFILNPARLMRVGV